MTGDERDAARDFAREFHQFIDWTMRVGGGTETPISTRLREHLGGTDLQVVSREWGAIEHVNLQRAVDEWIVQDDRDVTVVGLSAPQHFSGFGLGELIDGTHLPPLRTGRPDVTDLPSGPGETLACWQRALLLVHDARGAHAVLVSGPLPHEDPTVRVEVAGLDTGPAQELLAELDRLRSVLNVFRGHAVVVQRQAMGGVSLSFADIPDVSRSEVILPDALLDRIDRHALDITSHARRLRDAGQHLKRGLLLFGPPGTGKTHTVRYLIGRRSDATRLLLQGDALHAVGAITGLARELAPSVVVLEDVDLVAEDRSFGEHNPVLFSLLEAMDGSAADTDILFVLTTNRAEVLERALVQRPGRVDVAVQIERPDTAARLQLLRLYGADVLRDLTEDELAQVIADTEGVTASFLKELIRRSVLAAISDDRADQVSAGDIRAALDDLLDQSQSVTRSLLGLGDGSPDGGSGYDEPGGARRPRPGRAAGWFPYGPR